MEVAVSPSAKAHHTAKWARTMTKWLVTFSRQRGALWTIVDFGGATGTESRGIIDLMAIRKDHRHESSVVKRGDLLDIVLIQTKGGSARTPTPSDLVRLTAVKRHHRARFVVLVTWIRGRELKLHELRAGRWRDATAAEIFR
jgi:hypothetical protein